MDSHRSVCAARLVALILTTGLVGYRTPCLAQGDTQENTTSSTTYDSTGTVTAISPPLTITVNSRGGPFTYQLGPDLFVYGTENKAIKVGQVHKGDTVTVYYYKRFGLATVARIVVLKTAVKRSH